MKTLSNSLRYGLLVLSNLLGLYTFAQQNLIQVTPIVTTQCFDGNLNNLEALTRQITINIVNNTNCSIRIEQIEGSLEKTDNSFKIATKGRIPLREFTNIANFRGGLTQITAEQLEGVFLATDFDIPTNLQPVNGELRIPGGNYRFCIKLYGNYTPSSANCPPLDSQFPLNTTVDACAMIRVENLSTPQILGVNIDGSVIQNGHTSPANPAAPQSVIINWQPATGSSQPLVYDLFVVEIPPNDANDPNQAYNALTSRASTGDLLPDFPYFIRKEGVQGTSAVLTVSDIPADGFGLGQRYVVGVRARGLTSNGICGGIPNSGFSEIFVFQYGEAPTQLPAAPLTLTSFPPNGTYMPFRYMPIVIKYAPYSHDYRRFNSNFSINNTGGILYSRNVTNNWGNIGPMETVRSAIPNITQDRAQHLIVSAKPDARDPDNNYDRHIFNNRGDTYNWTADVSIEVQGQSTPLQQSISSSFIAGMAPAQLLLPTSEERVSVVNGQVKFKFKTSEPPATPIFPGYDLLQIRGNNNWSFHQTEINERCVLEIARDDHFTPTGRVMFREYRLNQSYLLDEWPRALTEVYKEIEDSLILSTPGTYYWRVKWMATPNDPLPTSLTAIHRAHYSVSEVRKFTIGDGPALPVLVASNQPPSPIVNDCNGICNLTPRGDTTESVGIQNNQQISIGAFLLRVSNFSGSTAAGFNGNGEIINFRDENTQNTWPARVEVEFTNLKINSLGIVHHGEAKAKGGGTTSTVSQLLTATAQALGIGQGDALKVPFGWKETIDGVKIALLLDEIKFTPKKATANVKIGYDINKDIFAGHPLMFEVSDICLKRGGFGDAFKLGLAQDLVIGDTTNKDNYAVYLFGNTSGRSEQEKTVLAWNCNGFEYLQVGGKVVFPRKVLIPENENGVRSTAASEVVEGFFNAKLERSQDDNFGFISAVDFKDKAFQFTSLPGFGVKVKNAVFDLSEASNDPAMQFPEGYHEPQSTSISDENRQRLLKGWTGFYLKEMSFRLPNDFRNAAGERMAAGIKNVLIDNEGVTGKIYWDKLINTGGMPDSGQVNIFYFTLDEISVSFLKNTLTGGLMKGKIGLPIFENNRSQYLKFEGVLGQNYPENSQNENPQQRPISDGYNWALTVSPPEDQDLKISMWNIAKMKVNRSSFVKLQIGQKHGGSFNLSGEVSFNGQLANGMPELNLPGLSVENLAFSTIEGDANKDQLTGKIRIGYRVVWGHTAEENSPTSPNPNQAPPSNTPRSGPNYSDDTWIEPAAPAALAQLDLGGFALNINDIKVEGAETILSNSNSSDGNLKLKINLGFRLADVLSVENFDLTFKSNVRLDISKGVDRPDLTFAFVGINGPEQIRLRGDVAGVSLQGCVKFSKTADRDGIAGGIKATIPMLGVVAVAAEFGNAPKADGTRYEYFNIQALFRSESGITLFAGINLYGLSGGVWHHMRKTPGDTPAVPTSGGNARSDTTVNCGDLIAGAGVQFIPDSEVIMGLDFKAYFGCTGNSATYNFDVGLTAQATRGQGLNLIKIEGNLYVMKQMGTVASQSAAVNIRAKVSFEWQKNSSGDESIDVAFDLSVLLKAGDTNLIYGIQNRDEFIAASARFHSTKYANGSPGIWFFKMGDPFNPQLSGLEINLFGVAKVTVNTYLYTGVHPTEIPTGLPGLPTEIQELIGGNFENRGNNEVSNVSPNSANRVSASPLTNPTFGFGFGVNFTAQIKPSFLIFYADLKLILGMDAMIREYNDGYCGDMSGKEWYAQAQAYAGIKGEFGVEVDLVFIKGKFPIVSLGAGIAMQVGLPKPAYFVGMAGMNYSILGGMVSGRCNFKIDIGERCKDNDPLKNIKFIGDITPEKGSRDVSIYTRVGVAFNYPMNKTMELIDDQGQTRQFRPVFNSLQVKKGNEIVGAAYGESALASDGFSVSFKPNRTLAINSEYAVVCQITFQEIKNGIVTTFKKTDGTDYVEEATATFKTQTSPPTTISEENISYTWPGKNQRFFIPGTANPAPPLATSGVIWLQQTENENVFRPGRGRTITGATAPAFTYHVRIVSPNGQVSEENISSQVRGRSPLFINYQLPSNLHPETIYNVQIIRRGQETGYQAIINVGSRSEAINRPLSNTLRDTSFNAQIAANSAERNIKTIKLPHEEMGENVLLIYNYYFRTSKFQSPAQKLQQATLRNFSSLGTLVVGDLHLEEALDQYDVRGLEVKQGNGASRYYPVFSIDLAPDDPLDQQLGNYTNAILNNLRQSIVATRYNYMLGGGQHNNNFMEVLKKMSEKYYGTEAGVTIAQFGNYGPLTSRLANSIGVVGGSGFHILKYTFDFPLESASGVTRSFTIGSSFEQTHSLLSEAEIRAAYGDNTMLVLGNILQSTPLIRTSPTNLSPSPAATSPATSGQQQATTTTSSATAFVSATRNNILALNSGQTFRFVPPAPIKYGVSFTGFYKFDEMRVGVHHKLQDFLQFVEIGKTASSIDFQASSPQIFSQINRYLGRQAVQLSGPTSTSSHFANFQGSPQEIFGMQRKVELRFGRSIPQNTKRLELTIR